MEALEQRMFLEAFGPMTKHCTTAIELSRTQLALFCQAQLTKKNADRRCETEPLCEVCSKEEISPRNKMLFCGECGVRVHTACYLVIDCVKEFRCDLCREVAPDVELPFCFLCPAAGGAMKKVQIFPSPAALAKLTARRVALFAHPTADQTVLDPLRAAPEALEDTSPDCADVISMKGTMSTEDAPTGALPDPTAPDRTACEAWAHLSCLYWTAALTFQKCAEGLVVKNLGALFREVPVRCYLCGSDEGSCTSCQVDGCVSRYHVECGRRGGCHFFVSQNRNYGSLCAAHSPAALQNALALRAKRREDELRRYLKHSCAVMAQLESTEQSAQRPDFSSFGAAEENEESGTLLDAQALRVFQRVKLLLREEREFFVRVNLTRDLASEQYYVTTVHAGNRTIVESEMSPYAPSIQRVAREMGRSCEWVHRRFNFMRRAVRLQLQNSLLQHRSTLNAHRKRVPPF